jgi:hydrogenase expression/formation protein HypC
MCLGVPGQVVEVEDDAIGMPMGKVSFGGVAKRVCLAYTPEAAVGDWVVVHVGFSISRIDEEEALQVFETLRELGELEGIDLPQPSRTGASNPEPGGGAGVSLSPREGGRGIEGEGGRSRGLVSLSPREGGRGIEGEGG